MKYKCIGCGKKSPCLLDYDEDTVVPSRCPFVGLEDSVRWVEQPPNKPVAVDTKPCDNCSDPDYWAKKVTVTTSCSYCGRVLSN